MKTVLAPIDFSPASEAVIRSAIALARSIDARLVLLHVIPERRITGGPVSLTLAATDLMVETTKEAVRRLTRLQRALLAEGVTAHVMHARGEPRQCILDHAQELYATYVVMAAHGDPVFDLAVMGGTVAGVLKRHPCPVVIVPHKAASPMRSASRGIEALSLAGVH
jgi:universal stress protein A